MDIKDVKVGDRCWVAWDGLKCDAYGQNATVTQFVHDDTVLNVYASMDGEEGEDAFTPGDTMFWRKPEAPPKPLRKVTKTLTGFIIPEHLKVLLTFNDSSTSQDRSIDMWETRRGGSSVKCTITVEVEE